MTTSAVSLRLEPGSSITLTTTLALAHGTAAAAIVCTPWPYWAQAICLLAVLSGAVLGTRIFLRENGVKALCMLKDASWRLTLRDGGEWHGTLNGESLVSPWLCLFVLDGTAGRRRVLILRDSLDRNGFRRLRVGLRVRPASGRAAAPSDPE